MTLNAEERNELRLYLLGNLTQEAQQRVEQCLLTDPDFLEELILDEEELIDDYVSEDLSDEDRLKFERHFLSTPERHRQLRFARALSRYTSYSTEKAGGKEARAYTPAPPAGPNWAERFRAFWNGQTWALRAASALVLVAVIAGALWLSRPRTSPPKTFVTLTLTAVAGNRAEGAQASKVSLPPNADALRISLLLPDAATKAASYRVELVSGSGEIKPLEVAGQDARSVSVVIPAARLARGSYALRLSATGAEGTERRVGYLFTVE